MKTGTFLSKVPVFCFDFQLASAMMLLQEGVQQKSAKEALKSKKPG